MQPPDAAMKNRMRKKRKRNRQNSNSSAQPLKRMEVSLDGATIKMAVKLGEGDLSLGIRRAVVLATMRRV
jgi:hypothetical protein